ncbi:MAG: ricin-type beta-trefoil lectin domain protein [Saccharothrix sp.]|nr:ricin-type beta-trefoil lectin domain protein [Saccharothrix sp.]
MLHHKLIKSLAVVATVVLAGVLPGFTGTASASRHGLVYNNANGQCLDVHLDELYTDGARIQLWDCHGNPNQVWYVDEDSYMIYSPAGGRCLDADPSTTGKPGGRVQLWTCHGGSNQQWDLHWLGSGTWAIESRYNGHCLDANASEVHRNGATVQLWPCHYGANQQWYF